MNLVWSTLILISHYTVNALDNGLALTPPMGWLTWERFRCNTDCVNDPENCISERLIMIMADRMVADGYRDAGYKYIIIDDCWPAKTRDKHGRLQPDPERFPSGIKNLADYVHSKGLLFGIYEDFGTKTCAGYPGSEFFMMTDANTFAEWGVDYVKFDGCNSDVHDMAVGYPAMSFYLNRTGRPMVYDCEWPLRTVVSGMKTDYSAVKKACNLWRNDGDIQDSWASVRSIITYYGEDIGNFSSIAGPGGWNDPDMLIIGDFSLSENEQRVQMAMWSIMASPLIMSNDLRSISSYSASLLQNKRLIAINQDPLGRQGKLIYKFKNSVELWIKEITPAGSVAIAILFKEDSGTPERVTFKLNDYNLKSSLGYNVTEVFEGKFVGVFKSNMPFKVTVNPHGVQVFTAIPLKSHSLKFL